MLSHVQSANMPINESNPRSSLRRSHAEDRHHRSARGRPITRAEMAALPKHHPARFHHVHMDDGGLVPAPPHASPAFAQASLEPPIGKVITGFPQSTTVSRALRSVLRKISPRYHVREEGNWPSARLSRTHVELRPSQLLPGSTLPQATSSCGFVLEAQSTVNGPLLVLERSTPGLPSKCSLLVDLGMPVPRPRSHFHNRHITQVGSPGPQE